MEKYEIETENFDLELTLTCGQTFCWNRINGDLYGEGPSKFYTFRKGKPLIVEQNDNLIVAETDLPRQEVVNWKKLEKNWKALELFRMNFSRV